ncbi:MAG: hypothetical protein HYY16_17840 [Planctomycetes bacterium]|nr:hypothetical protein [Planctomycetota bacterium]
MGSPESRREWMVGLRGFSGLLTAEEVVSLMRAGQMREEDLVKRRDEPWRPAREIAELAALLQSATAGTLPLPSPGEVAPPKTVPAAERPSRFRRLDAYRGQERKEAASTATRPKVEAAVPDPSASTAGSLGPLPAKYYSPAELVRDTSFAFHAGKLAVAFITLFPCLFVCACLGAAVERLSGEGFAVVASAFLRGLSAAVAAVGGLTATVLLTWMTRRQLEGAARPLDEMKSHALRALPGVAIVAGVLGALYAMLRGILWLLQWVRDQSQLTSYLLRYLEFMPLTVSAGMVATLALGASGLLYMAVALAVENCTTVGALKYVRSVIRGQGGRVALHLFIMTCAVAGAGVICRGLVTQVWILPHTLRSGEPVATVGWLPSALYDQALPNALIATIPLTLLATLGVLSYLVMRHPEDVALGVGVVEPGETSAGDPGGPSARENAPMEQTSPAATRPSSEGLPEAPPELEVEEDTEEPPGK